MALTGNGRCATPCYEQPPPNNGDLTLIATMVFFQRPAKAPANVSALHSSLCFAQGHAGAQSWWSTWIGAYMRTRCEGRTLVHPPKRPAPEQGPNLHLHTPRTCHPAMSAPALPKDMQDSAGSADAHAVRSATAAAYGAKMQQARWTGRDEHSKHLASAVQQTQHSKSMCCCWRAANGSSERKRNMTRTLSGMPINKPAKRVYMWHSVCGAG